MFHVQFQLLLLDLHTDISGGRSGGLVFSSLSEFSTVCGDPHSNGNPLQNSCLENPMDGGAWSAAVHGVAKSRTRLSDFTSLFTFHFPALEKEMAIHCSVLAWRIPGTGEPDGLRLWGCTELAMIEVT